ncbi:MAG: non-homologous end-joining DNA ligase [Rhodopila sp.]
MAHAASSQRDTSIRTYQAKRDFAATPEPAPGRHGARSGAPIFVVQKHQAKRAGLHWDFRLEHNGVLWSWAVRKGPSLNPADKRIAAHVEDHPLDYADFQGSIPEGYGAGTVQTWDRGTWQPLADPDDGMRDGEIKFVLSGTRLHGRFTLVRIKPRPGQRGRQDNWLLIKGHDAEERPGMDATALEAEMEAPGIASAEAVGGPGPAPEVAVEASGGNSKRAAGAPGRVRTAEASARRGAVRGGVSKDTAPQTDPVEAKRPEGKVAKAPRRKRSTSVAAKETGARTETVEGVTLTHPDRPLWPGISKRDLVTYWQTVADRALPGLAHRPLAIVRCPEGIDGEHFFQRHGHGTMLPGVREDNAGKVPFLVIDGLQGLIAMAQLAAIELHAWGAREADPLHADQLVFDLDPGEEVTVRAIVAAAQDVRARLEAAGLASFCRTSGGKGLHVVVPIVPEQPWDAVRGWCKAFAEALSNDSPDKYLARVKLADRRGRILIDWLRNGLGASAVASFCPRARPGAGVATPLAWAEVTPDLDLTAFTLQTVPARLAGLTADPWAGFEAARRRLPAPVKKARASAGKAAIVTAKAPKPRQKS